VANFLPAGRTPAEVGAVCATNVFDLQDGRAGYVIDLMITNQISRPVRCRDIELRTPWVDSQVAWLSDPRETASDPHNYRFPGRAAPEFPRDLVLNHVLLDGGILKPGCPKRGWLLGIGRSMPDNLHQGEWIGVTLTIIAHDQAEYSTTITLGVDHATKLTQKSPRKVPRESLFAKESARGFGSLNSGDVGPTPARDSLVPGQDAVHGARLGSSLYD